MAGTSKTTFCMLIRLRTFWGFCSSESRNLKDKWFLSLLLIFLFNCSSPRPPSNTGCRRQYIGSEKQAEPVVVLDPVSTYEPQTKDQVAEKDPTQHKDDEGEIKPEDKEDSVEKIRDTDSSNCWSINQKADMFRSPFQQAHDLVLVYWQGL